MVLFFFDFALFIVTLVSAYNEHKDKDEKLIRKKGCSAIEKVRREKKTNKLIMRQVKLDREGRRDPSERNG
jgi:hypothetical protein